MYNNYSQYPIYSSGGSVVSNYAEPPKRKLERWQLWVIIGCGVLIMGLAIFGVVQAILGKNTHMVYFDSNGGTSVVDQEVVDGRTASEPEEPTRIGYSFAGWYNGDNKYNFSFPVTDDVYLKAHWNKESTTYYSVVFNAANGDDFYRQMVAMGDRAVNPTTPTREGYVFVGWYDGDEKYNFNNIVTKDLVLVAKWQKSDSKEYVVEFDSNGGSAIATQVVESGNKAKNPGAPVRDGYEFTGWYLDTKVYDFDKAVTADLRLTARWARSEVVKTWTPAAENVEKPTESGSSSPSDSSSSSGHTPTTPAAPTTPVTPTPVYHAVFFDSNGGSSVASQSILHGSTAVQPTAPTREGYAFTGWYSNGSQYDFSSVVTSPITLQAGWTQNTVADEPDEPTKKVAVKFMNGDSVYLETTVVAGNTVSQPTNPTKSGYTFKGWKLNGSYYDFTKAVLQDTTLTADWEKNSSSGGGSSGGGTTTTKYTVTFNSDGGSSVSSQTVVSGKTATKPTDPTRTDYVFDGWYLGSTKYDFSTLVTSNITLKAKWTYNGATETTYTVSFNTHGGSAVSAQTVTAGNTVTAPKNPTRSGYSFNGWYTDSGAYDFNTAVEGDMTIYALWAPTLDYSDSASGKWIFINNPEFILDKSFMADSTASYGHHLLYKDTVSKKTEIYWEHSISDGSMASAGALYYGFRFYNSGATTATLKVNSCGAGYNTNWLTTWEQYYTGTCNIKGTTIQIPARGHATIFLNNDQSSSSSKESFKIGTFESGNMSYDQDQLLIPLVGGSAPHNYNAFDGVLNVTPSAELDMAVLVFHDYSKTGNATYTGNVLSAARSDGAEGLYLNTGGNISNKAGSFARLSTGYYNALPEKNDEYDV